MFMIYSYVQLSSPIWIYRLQQVLLQSEEELMANRSSELPKEAAAPKPKQMVGKMKIQGNDGIYL